MAWQVYGWTGIFGLLRWYRCVASVVKSYQNTRSWTNGVYGRQPVESPSDVSRVGSFKFDKSIFIKFTQEANIQFILVAEDVSKLETSKTVSFLHPSNIPQKSLTCDVSNGIIKAVKEEQYSNIPACALSP